MRIVVRGNLRTLEVIKNFLFTGTNEENDGDKLLLEKRDEFSWFPHMWSHEKVHLFDNATDLCELMKRNQRFAQVK